MVDWTLVAAGIAAVGSVGAAAGAGFGSRAAFVQARASKVAAGQAADAARGAARIAGEARMEMARLIADLEKQRQQRDELMGMVAYFLAASHIHRQSVENLFEHRDPPTRDNVEAALSELRELELLRKQLWLVSGDMVTEAVDDLYGYHYQAGTYYRRLQQPPSDLIVGMLRAEYELVVVARSELGTPPIEPPPTMDNDG